jgi:hypothetical protein
MDRYLIETPHTEQSCLALIDELHAQGYLSNFDWGCKAGVHTGWALIEAENEPQARLAVPPLVRSQAHVIRLNKFDATELALLHAEEISAAQTAWRPGQTAREEDVLRPSQVDFVRQQGFIAAGQISGTQLYSALMFQPRLIGILVAAGIALQSRELFLALSVILWWNALLPSRNPFDALYNHLLARPRGLPRLTPAPAPRRFAQSMAATFMLVIGLALLFDWQAVAWGFESLMAAALLILLFGRFCLGSYVFRVLGARSRSGLSARA